MVLCHIKILLLSLLRRIKFRNSGIIISHVRLCILVSGLSLTLIAFYDVNDTHEYDVTMTKGFKLFNIRSHKFPLTTLFYPCQEIGKHI